MGPRRHCLVAVVVGFLLAACAAGEASDPDGPVGPGGDGQVADARPPDANPAAPDARPPDASPGTPDAIPTIDGGGACPPAPGSLSGCASCGAACDAPWPVAWGAVSGATHYIIQYSCFTTMPMYQTSNTTADLCTEVGMCNNDQCSFGAGPVTVKACNTSCCSAAVTFPVDETPIACGGGVCC